VQLLLAIAGSHTAVCKLTSVVVLLMAMLWRGPDVGEPPGIAMGSALFQSSS
jgi:hypothetical protein